jgi:hypothetical protein
MKLRINYEAKKCRQKVELQIANEFNIATVKLSWVAGLFKGG